MKHEVKQLFDSLIDKYPILEPAAPSIESAFEVLRESFGQGGKLLVCGNGGSASDAEHIVGELMKGFMLRRPLTGPLAEPFAAYGSEGEYVAKRLQRALPAISLVNQTSLATAILNDVASDMVFAQQVYGYGRLGDVLLGLSTSGNSRNVLYAIYTAKALRVKTVGLTGCGEGAMKQLCDVCIQVPAQDTPSIQELHLPIYHALCRMLELHFFADTEILP